MYKRFMIPPILLCLIWIFAGAPLAAAQDQAQTGDQNTYGWQLMTPQERDEYRARMREMKTEEEREAFTPKDQQ